jgi:hypothetical protein
MGKYRITLKETTIRLRQVEVEDASCITDAYIQAGNKIGQQDFYSCATPPLKTTLEIVDEASFEIGDDGYKKE